MAWLGRIRWPAPDEWRTAISRSVDLSAPATGYPRALIIALGLSVAPQGLDPALAQAVVASPAAVQPVDAEAWLRDLIPDAAVDDPDAWARADASPVNSPPPNSSAASDPASVAPIDPTSPLAELPGLSVPWPDAAPAMPALAALPPDPELAVEQAGSAAPQVRAEGETVTISDHLSLVFPARLQTFPEREQFVGRFRQLSSLQKYDSDNATIAQVSARARADKDLLEQLLRLYGYYDALVTQTVGNGSLAVSAGRSDVAVRFDVEPGHRYRFGAVSLGNLAQAGADADRLRAGFAIVPGDPLDNDRIVAQRTALDTALGEGGYPFARVGEADLLVDHKRLEGDLTIPVEPGGKYLFGPIVSQNPKFLSSRHLQHIARFAPGDLYQRSDAEDLRRAILATGLVASVTVTPRATRAPIEPAAASALRPGEVAMDVAVVPGPLRTVAGLAGYETGDGFRLEASWEHRNFFPPEGMLRFRGVAGTKEQLIGSTVRWNNWRGRDRVLTLDVYANTVQREAYTARTLAFTANYEKLTTLLFQKPWVWSTGIEILATQERESTAQGLSVPRETFFIAALPARAALDYSDNLLDPTRGWRTSLKVSPELSKQLDGATVHYVRTQFDLSAYQPVARRVVLAARGRVGTITGTGLGNIAPSRRYYAGGGGSVRGYGYQQIGPRDTAGDPSGGRSLLEFSLEARIDTGLMDNALQVVPFIDAGTVAETMAPTFDGMRYGAGIGVRYKTGFGPIRFDLGTPLNPRAGDGRITVSIALGQAF